MIRIMKNTMCMLLPLLLSCTLQAAESLIPGNTDEFPPNFRAIIINGSPKTEGRIPSPWVAGSDEGRGQVEIRVEADPVHGRASIGLYPLSGSLKPVLSTDPEIQLQKDTRYLLSFDVLTRNAAKGSLQLSGAIRKTLPLLQTRGSWVTQEEEFVSTGEQLRLAFTVLSEGEANSLHLRNLKLIPADGQANSSAGTVDGKLPGLYGKYQEMFSGVGRMSFLNANRPDRFIQQMEGGSLRRYEEGQQPFILSLSRRMEKPSLSPQGARIEVENRNPVLKGEQVMAIFWARGRPLPGADTKGWGAQLQCVVRGPGDHPSSPSVPWQWTSPGKVQDLRDAWQLYWVPTRWAAHRDIKAGELSLQFWMGQLAQEVEIAGIALVSIPNANLSKLPPPRLDYPGRAADAAWRAEAEKRIETHRKADMKLRIVDSDGNALPNVRIEAELKSHRFRLGSTLSLLHWHGRTLNQRIIPPEDQKAFQNRSMAYFNEIRLEDAFGVADAVWDQESYRARVSETLTFYQERKVNVLSGALWTPGQNAAPSLPQRLQGEGVDTVANWILVSDTGNTDALKSQGGAKALRSYFQQAGEALQEGQSLWLEEPTLQQSLISGSFEAFGIKANQGWPGFLKEEQVPLQGLSLAAQGGLLRDQAPETWWKIFDLLQTRFDLRIRIHNLNVPTREPDSEAHVQAQVDMMRDSLYTLFAHPAVDGVTFNGFWEGLHTQPSAALWNQRWQTTPLGDLVVDLFYKQWTTKLDGQSDENGLWDARGFQGSYRIKLTGPDGKSIRRVVELGPEGVERDLRL